MKVVVLKGGRSSEHDVSLSSAEAVVAGLRDRHDVTEVLITKDGQWLYGDEEISLHPAGGLLGADVVFPVLHGPYGEDGVVQGALEVAAVPYVGSNVSASALCMDKLDLKDLLAKHGIPQVEYEWVSRRAFAVDQADVRQRVERLGYPLFVKPARLGSSVGISKVNGTEALADAISLALEHDSVAVVEAAAPGIEVECGVLGTIDPLTSVPGELKLHAEWYDYEAKYKPGGVELVIPARISQTAATRVQELAKDAFRRAGCSGLARIDFFVDGDDVLLNEINTMPGFTPLSAYPKLLEASGVSYDELLDRLLDEAIARHAFVASLKH